MATNPYTLIIPDIHERMSVLLDNRKLAKLMVDAERIVMLGDYYDGAGHWEWMTQFLEHSEDGRVTWLLGNHDAQYMFPHPWLRCPGYQRRLAPAIFKRVPWDMFRLHTWVGPYLCSHAGFRDEYLMPGFANPNSNNYLNTPGLVVWLDSQEETALDTMRSGCMHPWFLAGARDGGMGYGGPLWLRWEDFQPIIGLPQIVGHTPGECVRCKYADGPEASFCLDSKLQHVLQVFHSDWTCHIQSI